jgi:glycosyltransferase involved in cell wall biosynthesis
MGTSRSLIVEGWRFLPHSYAIVNQWQLLALLRRNIAVKIIDVPFYRPSWQAHSGLFDARDEERLRSIETAQPDDRADVTLRIFAPFTFAPSRSPLTAVFATLEQQVIQRHQLSDPGEFEQLRQRPPPAYIKAVTPSRWSAEGFYAAGFTKEQVLIVPHGVDIGTFHPMPDRRAQIRREMSVSDSEFVFLSVGAMTGNKGIDLLLRGFAETSRKFPNARLILKGMDHLYGSGNFLRKSMQTLSSGDRQWVADRMTYLGESFSHQDMARLYQVADAYVSPYRAEGFNIPVLEAAACGVPIVCTGGGSTDDFVRDEFARRIASRKSLVSADGASRLNPDLEHLTVLMASAITDGPWRRQASEAGPRHVGAHYTWDCAVDTLTKGLQIDL